MRASVRNSTWKLRTEECGEQERQSPSRKSDAPARETVRPCWRVGLFRKQHHRRCLSSDAWVEMAANSSRVAFASLSSSATSTARMLRSSRSWCQIRRTQTQLNTRSFLSRSRRSRNPTLVPGHDTAAIPFRSSSARVRDASMTDPLWDARGASLPHHSRSRRLGAAEWEHVRVLFLGEQERLGHLSGEEHPGHAFDFVSKRDQFFGGDRGRGQ
jgi:hypothetical protein